MPEMTKVEQPKVAGFVNQPQRKTRQQRIEEDEKELEELEKQLRGETTEGEEEDPKEKAEVKEEPKEVEDNDTEELKGEEKTYKKRYGDLRRHQQKVEKELKDQIEELKGQLEGKEKGIALPKSDEDLEAWMKKYPDVAGIVKALVAKETDSRLRDSKKDLEALREEQTKTKQQKAREEIMEVHPDFEDLEADDAFHDWVDEQPRWIADALFENSDEPKAVIRVLDLYKSDTSGQTPQKKSEKAAATSVKTKGRAVPDDSVEKGSIRESDVNKMSDKEYEEREEEILAAMASGKFIYDMTGGAR